MAILPECARRLAGLPVLFIGVRCPIEEILRRRAAVGAGRPYVIGTDDDPVPLPVRLWQEEVHKPGIYDLEVDTSLLSPHDCAEAIQQCLTGEPEPSACRSSALATKGMAASRISPSTMPRPAVLRIFQTLAQLPIDGQ